MELYVGLDISQSMTHLCVVDSKGKRIWEGKCASPGRVSLAIWAISRPLVSPAVPRPVIYAEIAWFQVRKNATDHAILLAKEMVLLKWRGRLIATRWCSFFVHTFSPMFLWRWMVIRFRYYV